MLQADDGTADRQERLVDVCPPLTPDVQAPVAQAKFRSPTQRCRPKRVRDSIPLRAIRILM